MINDLPAWLGEIKNIKSALFTDDLVIWTSVPKRQEYQLSKIMNEALTVLGNWCNENAMTINTGENILSDINTESQKIYSQFKNQ
jgi:hypothetical protein